MCRIHTRHSRIRACQYGHRKLSKSAISRSLCAHDALLAAFPLVSAPSIPACPPLPSLSSTCRSSFSFIITKLLFRHMHTLDRNILLTRDRVGQTSKDKHFRANQAGSMRKPSFGQFSFSLNVIDPPHVFNVQSCDFIVVNFILKIRSAIVPAKEHQHHIVKDTALFFLFWRELACDFGRSQPRSLRCIESVVILQNSVTDSTEDYHFWTVRGNTVEGSAVGEHFFYVWIRKLMDIDVDKSIYELASSFSFDYKNEITSKNENMIANGAKRMTFHLFIRQLTVRRNPFPLKASAGDVFLTGKWLPGPPSSWSFNSVRVSNDTIILSTILVDNCGIFFVNQILFSELELELVRGVGEEAQVDVTTLRKRYFS